MERSDRLLRNVLVVIAVLIVGWSFVGIGGCIDMLDQPRADALKQTIEDPDWDSVR